MNYRLAEILATMSISTAHTEPISLKGLDCISRLMVVIELVNNGKAATNHPLAALPKIEIVDGSDRIASMTGYEAQAMAYYDTGKMPHNELNYEDNAYCRAFVPINFGRWLYDPDLALDPSKFKNLQLRISHDRSLGGCTPDGAYIRVFADLFDEKQPSPVGYLMSKEIFSYTPATGAKKYVDLPVDNDIRKIIVMNTNDAEEPDIQFESVKIDENKGKHVIYDGLTMDLIRVSSLVYAPFQEYLSGELAAAADWTAYLSACKDIQVGLISDTVTVLPIFIWSGGRVRVWTFAAGGYVGGTVSGRCPHGSVPILFGNQQDPADWWNLDNVDDARLKLTPRAVVAIDTAKTTDTVVQSLQKY